MTTCLKVKKESAEKIREYLFQKELLNVNFKITSENNFIILPLQKKITKRDLKALQSFCKDIDFIERQNLIEIKKKSCNYFDLLKESLNKNEFLLVPKSFDTIGDIVVIEIPEGLWLKKELIGNAILKAHSSVKTVYAKSGKISGVNRIRPVKYLLGEQKTKTIYIEYGVKYAVDIIKAYFSPRLSEEHFRIAKQVKENEIVIDLFCGIGPFVLQIAKRVYANIHAIDINPEAIKLLTENITLNKLKGKIKPYCGDCRVIIKKNKLENLANRVIMNLPGYAINFIDVACKALKAEGGIIHFFEFVGGSNPEEEIINDLKKTVEKNSCEISEILKVKRVRMSAPKQWQMVVDAKIKKDN